MLLGDAKIVADQVRRHLVPHCHRIEIAGSIRRCRPDVGDIEIVALPRRGEVTPPGSLFPVEGSMLHDWAMHEAVAAGIRWIKPGTSVLQPWEPNPDARYLRAALPTTKVVMGVGDVETIQEGTLDLFLATPENWGLILLIRTGSWAFSRALVTHSRRAGYPCEDGYLRHDGKLVETPEEEDVFDLLGLEWVEPQQRTGPEAIRPKARGTLARVPGGR